MQPGNDNSTVGRETYSKILPAVVDAFNNSNVIAMRVFNNPKRWVGKYVEQVIQTSNSSTGGSFSGLDQFDTTDQENEVSMRWYVKGYYQSIVVPGFDYALNETPQQAISYLGQKMDKAKNSMVNGLGSLVYGLGLGKDIDGLGKIVDDSTSTSSYGELARATYGTNINANVAAAGGGTLTLDLMRAADNAAKAAGSTTESPTNIITTKDGFSFYEELLTPTLQANYGATSVTYGKITPNTRIGGVERGQGLAGMSGFNTLDFRGLTVVADDKCTSGVMFFVNEHYLEFQSLNHPKLKTISMKNQVTEGVYKENTVNTAFQYKDLQMPDNQLAEVGQIILMGQLIHRNPRRNAKITDLTNA